MVTTEAPATTAQPNGLRYRFARLRMARLVLWPLGGMAVVLLLGLIPRRPTMGTMIVAVAYVLYALLMLAAVRACGAAGIAVADVLGPTPRDSSPWLKAASLGPLILMFSAVSLWATVYVAARVAPGWAAQQLADRDGPARILERLAPMHRWLLMFNITLLAPFVEEFVFRGMLLRRWQASRGFWTGLLGSSAVFAFLHPPVWIGSFVFGVVAGILYLWSGSLLVPVLVHVLNNAFVVLTIATRELLPTETEPTPTLAEFQSEWIVPLTMLLAVGALLVAVTRPLLRQVRAERIVMSESRHLS